MKRELMNMFAAVPFAIVTMCSLNGVGFAQQSAQPTFPSPAEAGQRLFQAVQNNQEREITKILGGPSELASSRDDDQDKVDRQLFVEKYQQMHRLRRDADGTMTLYIGAENWPFPLPLVQKNGAWRFDPDAGSKEVLFRRIGENEFMAIAICREFVAGEKQYRTDPNGANPTSSLPTSLVAMATRKSTSSEPVLFHGYRFQVLAAGASKPNNGFVFVAYPAEYRSSGVMTFFVTGNGVVYEKDLGTNTSSLVNSAATFHKDSSWRAADQ
jgi:hypothetical protein